MQELNRYEGFLSDFSHYPCNMGQSEQEYKFVLNVVNIVKRNDSWA
jgi:hypothetical protein